MQKKNTVLTKGPRLTLDEAFRQYLFVCEKPESRIPDLQYKSALFACLTGMLAHDQKLLTIFQPRIARERSRIQNILAAQSKLDWA